MVPQHNLLPEKVVDAGHDPAHDPAHLDEEGGDQGEQASSSAAVQVHQSNRKEGAERRAAWMQDFGSSLFDVFSEIAMVKTLGEGLCFVSDFIKISRMFLRGIW